MTQLQEAPGATPTSPSAALHAPPPAAEPDHADVPPSRVHLSAPELYLNRELTWLAFNRRVLHEATDERNPLLERVKFLAITGSNLDEFVMKRIGGLKQQIAAGVHECTVDGRTPQQQLFECYAEIRSFEPAQRVVWAELQRLLAEHEIRVRPYAELTAPQKAALREKYVNTVFPLTTPLVLDPAHPFPFISNLSLNLLVTGRFGEVAEPIVARVKVPIGQGIARLMRVGTSNHFVPLEQVMANNLDLLFPDLQVESCELFRVTRNANTERDEDEADDLLAMIETELRDRRVAPIVRLQVETGMKPLHRGMLAAELGLDETADVFEAEGLLGMRDLMELTGIEDAALHDPPLHPVDPPRLPATRNIFHSIRDVGSVLVIHPYESFATSTERFLRDASEDPKVRAIKMTLYRTSPDARIIDYLCDAARNGKQVAVVVELKARFDEAANIAFVRKLEEFGIHVSYGVIGYKTHCKTILVVRQDYDRLRLYSHIGTGNYHPGTARIYADAGLLTSDPAIGADLTELFNFLTTGYQPRRRYRKILPAPALLKDALLEKIEREAKLGSDGAMQLKMNALEDQDITRALYRAARAGAKVELIVRDTCRLRPGLPGLSESVRVVSVVGRFLEHARIYYFRNGGSPEYLIGSADCMKRNLESRIEVVAPVEDPGARRILRAVFDLQLAPNRDAWEMHPDGSYAKTPEALSRPGAQQLLIERVGPLLVQEAQATRKRRRFARRFSPLAPV